MSLVDYAKGVADKAAKEYGDANANVGAGKAPNENVGENKAPNGSDRDWYSELEQAGLKAPMTEEQKKAEEKKHRRNKIFAAIGDGVSALSNLFFTTQYAPNMYNKGSQTMSAREKIRYDKLLSDDELARRERMNALFKAHDATDKDRRWRRMLEKDEADATDKDRRFQRLLDKDEADEAYREWKKDYMEGRAAAQDQRHEDNMEHKRNKGKSGGKSGGNSGSSSKDSIVFSDGSGNIVKINKSLWAGSMPKVFDTLVNEGVGKGNMSDTVYKLFIQKLSPQEQEVWVKQHWYESDAARRQMLDYANTDVTTIKSGLVEDDEDDEFSEFIVEE